MNKFFLTGALLLAALGVSAQEQTDADTTPLWLRNTAISPDGQRIAFTYKGDIYTVATGGGTATRLTTQGYNSAPTWSPDGTRLAFNGTREGSVDIYVMPSEGGTPRRLTTFSGKESVLSWLGNDAVLFSCTMMPAQQAAQGGFQSQVYSVAADGKTRPTLYMTVPAGAISVSSDGRVLYQDRKGYEDPLRKHERSSGTADIWLKEGDKFTRQTTFAGNDLNPVWAADGQSFYYTSEHSNGTLNVHRRSLGAVGDNDTALTSLTTHPVRSLSASNAGTLAFSWNGEIYTLAPGATTPSKVNVEIVTDDYTRELIKTVRRGGATSFSVSPEGDEVAFVVHGDVYVTSVKYDTTRQITNTPEQERCVSFAPDGRTLVYDGERDGQWQLFTATIDDDKEKHFTYATKITEKSLYRAEDGSPAFQPEVSPDGKLVAFLENRTTLRTVELKNGKNPVTVLDGKFNYSYTDGDISFSWSPDSRWLLIDYIGIGGWNNSDVAMVKADGSEVHDLTESGYTDGGAKWVLDGKAMIWSTDRKGYRSHGSWGAERDVYIMFFDGEAYDRFRMSEEELAQLKEKEGKKDDDKDDDDDKDKDKDKKKKVKPLEFDFENAKYRMMRLTPGASHLSDYLLSEKGDKFYFITSSPDGESNLWVRDLEEGDTRILARGCRGELVISPKDSGTAFLLDGGIKTIDLNSGSKTDVDFEARAEYRPYSERSYIYDHAWKQVKDKFYDVNLHNVDWRLYGDAYRRFLPHINNGQDFAELLSELLGELNASHTGARFYGNTASLEVPSLGAFFDDSYDGAGLKVTEVVRRGPLADKKADVKPGDVILAIEGQEIAPHADYFPMIEGRSGRATRLTIKRAKGGKTEDIVIKPISQGRLSDLLYHRWVEHNQQVVDSVSGGRIAYVHIEGMDSESYRTVYSELLGRYRNREAVIVDTRYNGGGWLHNDVAQLLSGREYVRFAPRGQYIGSEPFSQWTKPSAMLVNESNYSDAHGTPYTYQALGLGPVIGAPIPGTMTAVWWENQIDPSLLFGVPQVTSLDMKGRVLENQQLNPDVVIYNQPDEVSRGYDAQLIGATKHMLQQLDAPKQ